MQAWIYINEFNPSDFDQNYLREMIDASPNEYYARICAFMGA